MASANKTCLAHCFAASTDNAASTDEERQSHKEADSAGNEDPEGTVSILSRGSDGMDDVLCSGVVVMFHEHY